MPKAGTGNGRAGIAEGQGKASVTRGLGRPRTKEVPGPEPGQTQDQVRVKAMARRVAG